MRLTEKGDENSGSVNNYRKISEVFKTLLLYVFIMIR